MTESRVRILSELFARTPQWMWGKLPPAEQLDFIVDLVTITESFGVSAVDYDYVTDLAACAPTAPSDRKEWMEEFRQNREHFQVRFELHRLMNRFKWDLFGTFTFRRTHPQKACDGMFRAFISAQNCYFYGKDFLRGEQEEDEGLLWVRATEFHGDGRPHYHAVISGVHHFADRPFDVRKMVECWNRITKNDVSWNAPSTGAVVTPYDPAKRGIWYMLKSATRNTDHLAFSQNLRLTDMASCPE
jgi:hypothetical protein